MSQPVRVRFAPSPTGPLHIGGIRTALFNYLFAKNNGGTFILRIEDTDQKRFVEGAEAYILEALAWCGITIDEGPATGGPFGPYRQSERAGLYQKYVGQLLDKGKAYYAFDTPDSLDGHRKAHESKGKTFIYNWHNRQRLDNSLVLPPAEVARRLDNGEPYVVRFKCPEDRLIRLNDLIRGRIEVESRVLDDKILFKSDGMPTYHLANVVDDHSMEISHIIRGEEWLPSLALHQLLYEAFDWMPPKFAHLPLILKPAGKGKLSKRDGEQGGFPVFPLSWKDSKGYREEGYYPEAVVNFLALLGWNPGTEKEIFSMSDLIQAFSLDRVQKSGARFDPEKTIWYNQQYLQTRSDDELLADLKGSLGTDLPADDTYMLRVIALIRERAAFPQDIITMGDFFFKAPRDFAQKPLKKHWNEDTGAIIAAVREILEQTEPFTTAHLEQSLKTWIEESKLGYGKIMAPLRLILVGDLKGPHLFDIMALLGKEETLGRIDYALAILREGTGDDG